MQNRRLLPIALVILVGLGLLFTVVNRPAQAQEGNLLTNPSFEGQFASYVPELPQEIADCHLGVCTTAQTPAGWKPWWVKERGTDVNPEYKPATRDIAGNRVRTGDRAAQYFSFWSTHKAGLRQTVTVPNNSTVQFSVWGHAWMQESDTSFVSDYAGTSNMRVGIDPTGGIDAYSPNVIWSGFQQAFDNYTLFSVEGRAVGDKVTVFTFSAPSVNPNSPTAGFKHTDIYWDDASLIVVGAGSGAAPAPSGGGGGGNSAPAAAPRFVPGPTATPDAEGIIYAEVQPGDSLWAIAARAGLSLDDFLTENGLSRESVIRPGEQYIIGHGDPPAAEAEAAEDTADTTEEVSAELEPLPTPVPPVTPEIVAVSAVNTTGASICLTAFDDPNENGFKDAAEMLRPAVAFTISNSQAVISNYVTDGISEPFCIPLQEPGSYRVTRSNLPNEILTTAGDHSVSLTAGTSIDLAFGSYLSDETTVPEAAPVAEDDGLLNTLIIASVVVGILLVIAVVILIVTRRRHEAA